MVRGEFNLIKIGGTLVDSYRQYILKQYLEMQGMEDLVALVDAQVDNDTLRGALQEKILERDNLYQQMLMQVANMLENGIDIGESYETMLEIRKEYALLHPHYQLINQLIEDTEAPLGDCGCNN